jgi:SSS family solute:Na+ symporter
VLLFFFSIALIVVISLLTRAPEPHQLRYTYASATPEERAETRRSWNGWDVFHTVVILLIIVAFYAYFW